MLETTQDINLRIFIESYKFVFSIFIAEAILPNKFFESLVRFLGTHSINYEAKFEK